MKINKYIYILSTLLLLIANGCKKELDINTNPNAALDADVNLLLPSAEVSITYAVGNTLQIYGSIWGQYWTQSANASQYRQIEQYNPAASDFDNIWSSLNVDALQDLQTIILKSQTQNKKQYEAVASLLKAYSYQLSTDLFGDIPYTEALKGDKDILSPRFDKQEVIYDSLVVLVDHAISLIDAEDPNHPGSDDLIYGGDMDQWLRFANTLKLKIGLRLSERNATKAKAIVSSLEGVDFIQSEESALIKFIAAGGNQNPLYSAIAGPVLNKAQNIVASSTAIDFFTDTNDPRIEAFYIPATNGSYAGLPQGIFNDPNAGTLPFSVPSAVTGANANDPKSALASVKLMTDYEAKFLQAEAVARGWLSGDAAELYKAAIEDNFTAYGVEDVEDFYAQPEIEYPEAGTLPEKISAIITQKWAAMCGNQSIEAWTEWRRTGYPSFFKISAASIIGSNRVPQIFLYPTSETTRNSNAPGQHQIYDKVWWDVN